MRTTGVTKEVHMPVKSLPSNPSLEHLKYQARDLLKALSQGNADAVARAREFHRKFARMSDDEIRTSKLSLADAQLIIAREYGFGSWPKLKHHVEGSAQTASLTAGADFKAPVGPIELKQKWSAGARILRENCVKQNKEIHLPGKTAPDRYDVSMTTQYAYTVAKELPGGGREVDLEHLGFRVEEDSAAYLWRYDSTSKYAVGQPPFAEEPFKIIMASTIRCFLDANNQIERMEGVDELLNRLQADAGAKLKPGTTGGNQALDTIIDRITATPRQPIANTSWIKNMFNEGYFRNKFASLPARAIQPGDTWNVSGEGLMHKGNPVTTDSTVTFQCWEMRGQHICARLETRGTWKPTPQLRSENDAIFGTTVGTFSAVTWFDPALGRGIETILTQDFTVTWNRRAAPDANPNTGPIQISTNHYRVVITDKLVSVN